ncbi:hypothetical protein GCM10023149_27840 [Mucilaginibacter gynuensis]|uniref:ABC transporter domain-containing protein n=1 Tax=Mucilaginibacter gynuensis TaxID=1302236 RepID=A0ABP8GJD7_9SPHI
MIIVDFEKKLKAYNGQQALKLNHQFAAGSVTKIYGPSGAGKSTLLKVIAGLINPEAGTITVNGETWLDTTKQLNLSPQKRRVGFVFQDYALFPNMTVQQHLEYATTDADWIKRLLTIGRLEAFATHKPAYLSGGQQQRLAILRAIAIKPKVLLMDEPFSALDKEVKASLISDLKKLFAELNCTVLIVSHNQQELEAFEGTELYISGE